MRVQTEELKNAYYMKTYFINSKIVYYQPKYRKSQLQVNEKAQNAKEIK